MAIIGISGKMQSGKNTVASIIQMLTSPNYKNEYLYKVGIDVNRLSEYDFSDSIWKQKAFATKLKQIVSILTGIPVKDLEKQEVKNRVLGEEWRRFFFRGKIDSIRIPKSLYGIHVNEIEAYKTIKIMNDLDIATEVLTVRQLLQEIGTEAMRDVIHPNIWVNALFADYKSKFADKEGFTTYNKIEDAQGNDIGITVKIKDNPLFEPTHFPNWIITDMRFPNELEAVKNRGGISIRVNRPYSTVAGDNGIPATFNHAQFHPSETALDNAEFDHIINNNGTIEELIEKVREVLIQHKIL